MKILFQPRALYISIALIVITAVLVMAMQLQDRSQPTWLTTTAEIGSVRQLVSVSGLSDAKQTAELAFPVTGTIREVLVERGDRVTPGQKLATLDTQSLYADRQDAAAALARAVADRDELLSGPTTFAQTVTSETVASKEAALRTTIATEEQKIANAYRSLLSTDLTAYTDDATEEATPPTISGTYTCDQEGTYTLDMYASAADSGYSFRYSGLESGTEAAFVDQPGPLGSCGLMITFTAGDRYSNSRWHIDIPNTRSTSYTTNRNLYDLTVTQADSAIALAEQTLSLTKAEAAKQNAPARSEALARADAAVIQAQARLNRIEVSIAERTLTAPFAGTITNADILPGETVTTAPIITILAEESFEVTARIPEIDIGKLRTGQRVEMMFDTRPDEIQTGHISFISPRSTQIDGVAYFEAIIQFDQAPEWMKSGLNADIEIIIAERSDFVRVPKRFVTETATGYEVTALQAGIMATTSVTVELTGNDGYVAITGVTAGDILVAPQ